jgi:hypothetical protein
MWCIHHQERRVTTYQTTRHHIPENTNLHSESHGNLKPLNLCSCLRSMQHAWVMKMSILSRMDWITGFIGHLYTPVGTTSNSSAISNLHTLQFTTAPVKPFPACCVLTSRFLVKASNSGNSSASRAHVVPCRTGCQLPPPNSESNFLLQLPTISLPSLLDYSANCELRRLTQLSSTAASQLNSVPG